MNVSRRVLFTATLMGSSFRMIKLEMLHSCYKVGGYLSVSSMRGQRPFVARARTKLARTKPKSGRVLTLARYIKFMQTAMLRG